MTENRERTGQARDVPPPRPVAGSPPSGTSAEPDTESGLSRAGRLLADAVTGLLSGTRGGRAGRPEGRRTAAATAAGSRAGRGAAGRAPGDPAGDRAAPGEDQTASGPRAHTGRAPGALLGDLLTAAAPRLPIRDGHRLRRAFPGASDEEIADALVARAARLTGGIGAATGALSTAHWFAPPSLLAVPLEVGAETVLVAAVEVVLLGELHELYGRPASGDARTRALAYLASWTTQRAVVGSAPPGLGSILGSAGLRALRRRMTRRLARNVPSAAPFLVGAALGSRGNHRATESLARRVRADLRGRRR